MYSALLTQAITTSFKLILETHIEKVSRKTNNTYMQISINIYIHTMRQISSVKN